MNCAPASQGIGRGYIVRQGFVVKNNAVTVSSFFCTRMGLLTRLGRVQGLRWSPNLDFLWSL